MNVENMNKLIAQLRRIPREAFDLSEWFERRFALDDPRIEDYGEGDYYEYEGLATVTVLDPAWAAETAEDPFKCDTVACIAGHAALLAYADGSTKDASTRIKRVATDWLDLTDGEASGLFTPSFSTMSVVLDYETVTPEMAARVCEHFRDTGVVDWDKALSAGVDA